MQGHKHIHTHQHAHVTSMEVSNGSSNHKGEQNLMCQIILKSRYKYKSHGPDKSGGMQAWIQTCTHILEATCSKVSNGASTCQVFPKQQNLDSF